MAQRTTQTPPRSVVFIKLVEQGSTVLAYAALRRAIDRLGKETVYFMVFEENRFILDAMKMIEPANVLAIRNRGRLTAMADMLRALWTLRRRRVEAAIDLEFFARGSAALAWLSGCAVHI
ncbi:MAG: glycosyltransferase family 9 protein, partial [Deltaproteobacteria bacterium]|nr:glycosyltransferase family 9 protein [Deltaproteobacteria bacterium]